MVSPARERVTGLHQNQDLHQIRQVSCQLNSRWHVCQPAACQDGVCSLRHCCQRLGGWCAVKEQASRRHAQSQPVSCSLGAVAGLITPSRRWHAARISTASKEMQENRPGFMCRGYVGVAESPKREAVRKEERPHQSRWPRRAGSSPPSFASGAGSASPGRQGNGLFAYQLISA